MKFFGVFGYLWKYSYRIGALDNSKLVLCFVTLRPTSNIYCTLFEKY